MLFPLFAAILMHLHIYAFPEVFLRFTPLEKAPTPVAEDIVV